MPRCPDCNKFVSLDEPEVEVDGEDLISGGVCIEVTITLQCAECGTELKSHTLVHEDIVSCPNCGEDNLDELSLEDVEATGQEIYEDAFSVKTGRKLKNQQKYYGAEISYTVVCAKCEESTAYTAIVRDLPGAFEEC